MKRILSIALTLMLALSLFAGAAVAEEPRVLTIGHNLWMDGDWWEFDVFKQVQEELNMTIEVIEYNDDSFNAMLAGGDLPDIVITNIKMSNILNNKLAMNIAPYVEEDAPNMLGDAYSSVMKASQEFMGDGEGGIYIICPTAGIHNYDGGLSMPSRGYIVNWERYKAIGCPTISNDADYLEVLKQMWEANPTTEAGDTTFMFGLTGKLSTMGGYRSSFTKDVSLNHWCTYNYKNNIFTNDVVNCYTDVENSAYWADMRFYNAIYRMGGLDIDSFTMTSDEYSAKVEKQQYMGLYYTTNTNYVVVPSTGANFYANVVMLTGQAPTYYSFIAADSENWDLALKFYNYIYDLDFARTAYSGVQGKDWDYDANGVPSMTDEALAARAARDPYWTADGNGYSVRLFNVTGYNQGVLHTDGYPLDLSMTAEARVASQNDLQRDVAATYGVELWSDAYTKLEGLSDYRNSAEGLSGAIADMPMDMQRILESCNDVLYTSMPMLVMAESDEEFAAVQEEVLAEIAALGEAEVWEWYVAEWEKVRPSYNALVAEQVRTYGFEPYAGLE